MNDRLQFSQRVQLLEGAAHAAIAYDNAIEACANSPQSMSSFCTAEGDSLDVLYADWVSKSRAALAVAAAPVPAQEPFMFAIMTPDGSAHMDENCVGPDAASLYSELNGLNDSPDAGYSIVPLYRAVVQAQEPRKPTDISQRLREYASNSGYSHNDYADTMRVAADECERFYGGMVAWKETAQQKDRTIIDLRAKLADAVPGHGTAEQGDALNSAVQRAASELPDGYTITVEVERGYGGVSWRNPGGEQCDEYHSDILAEDVIDALADAKQDAAIAAGASPSIEAEAA